MTEGKPEDPVAEVKAEEPVVAATSDESAAAVPEVAVAARPSALGIWAFVLAMLGVLGIVPIIGSVLGFVLGRVAIRQAETRRVRGGRGLALAAVIISVITLVVIALSVAAYALAVAYLEI